MVSHFRCGFALGLPMVSVSLNRSESIIVMEGPLPFSRNMPSPLVNLLKILNRCLDGVFLPSNRGYFEATLYVLVVYTDAGTVVSQGDLGEEVIVKQKEKVGYLIAAVKVIPVGIFKKLEHYLGFWAVVRPDSSMGNHVGNGEFVFIIHWVEIVFLACQVFEDIPQRIVEMGSHFECGSAVYMNRSVLIIGLEDSLLMFLRDRQCDGTIVDGESNLSEDGYPYLGMLVSPVGINDTNLSVRGPFSEGREGKPADARLLFDEMPHWGFELVEVTTYSMDFILLGGSSQNAQLFEERPETSSRNVIVCATELMGLFQLVGHCNSGVNKANRDAKLHWVLADFASRNLDDCQLMLVIAVSYAAVICLEINLYWMWNAGCGIVVCKLWASCKDDTKTHSLMRSGCMTSLSIQPLALAMELDSDGIWRYKLKHELVGSIFAIWNGAECGGLRRFWSGLPYDGIAWLFCESLERQFGLQVEISRP